jgi:hypothetical protein
LTVDLTETDAGILGTGFILLDAIYILHSLICLVSVTRVVWNAANLKEVNDKNTAGVSVHPVSHHDLDKTNKLKKEISVLRLQKNIRQAMHQNNKAIGRSPSRLKSKKKLSNNKSGRNSKEPSKSPRQCD